MARDLLAESGSVFVQIGDENVHRVRAILDEVFGDDNFISLITTKKSGGMGQEAIDNISDYIIWYGKKRESMKYRPLYFPKDLKEGAGARYRSVQSDNGLIRPLRKEELTGDEPLASDERIFLAGPLISETASDSTLFEFKLFGHTLKPRKGGWKTNQIGMSRLIRANRLLKTKVFVNYKIFFDDFAAISIPNLWQDTMGTAEQNKVYVVQTTTKVVQRCLLMTTDPGDLVLDPTCGSGTTAYVAEQWGRRWITIDTSRVALALARARLMGARYPYYLLADSKEGQEKEAEVTQTPVKATAPRGNVAQGFVYERVPHITLKSIANNAEIDVIWDKWQEELEPIRAELVKLRGKDLQEWEIPRDPAEPWSDAAQKLYAKVKKEQEGTTAKRDQKVAQALSALNQLLGSSYTLQTLPAQPADPWPTEHAEVLARWWEKRIARQQEIDASIAAKADNEYLYDRPYPDGKKVRVAGPFTVESLSPHRTLDMAANGDLIDPADKPEVQAVQSFNDMILEQLKAAGVQQVDKAARINFDTLSLWPGKYVHAKGEFSGDDGKTQKAAICIGPEFGTMQRADIVRAAREATDAGFDVLIACAFNFEAHTTDFNSLGNLQVLKARMNADLHMGGELKPNGAGNLFVVFGEPDIEIEQDEDQVTVTIKGVDVFDPAKGEVRADDVDGIACWFIDTNYDSESFFVRQAYFLGAQDPYNSLKTSLKAEIDQTAWETLNSATSQPFDKPSTGQIAVKVINHLGDEVMKVFDVG